MGRYYYGFDNLVNEHHKYVIGPALSEPVIFNAMMAKVLCDFRCGRGILPSDFIPPDMDQMQLATADLAFYKMRTMQCLQDSLDSTKQTDQYHTQSAQTAAMFAIILMVKAEVLSGSATELELHLGALERLVKMGINLDHMSMTAKSPTLFTINIGCAVTRQVPPIIPPTCSDNDLPRLDEHLAESTGMSHLCTGFEDSAVVAALGPKLLCYLAWQKNFVLFKELALMGSTRVTLENYGVTASMIHRADYHLLSLHYLHKLTPVQEVARLSVLIADICAISNIAPKTLLARSLAGQLKKALQVALRSMSGQEKGELGRFLMWSSFLGAHMATGCKERPWFLMQLISLGEGLRVTRVEQLREIVLSFLYSQTLFKDMGGPIWEEMEELAEDINDESW